MYRSDNDYQPISDLISSDAGNAAYPGTDGKIFVAGQGPTVIFNLTQAGVADPTINIVRNDFIGVTFSATRNIAGHYMVTASANIFDPAVTFIVPSTFHPLSLSIGDPRVPFVWAGLLDQTSLTTIEVYSGLMGGGTTALVDDLLFTHFFLVTTY